jgi:sugar phosphate isomerase/epimerase
MSHVRIAGHTYPYRDGPLEAALDELANLGFTAVEVWLGHADNGPASVARALEKRGLEAIAVGGGGLYRGDSRGLERAVELAEAVGAPVLVVADVSRDALPRVVASLPQGLTVCLENHWDHWLSTPRTVGAALAAAGELAACLDTGHAIDAGVRPDRFARELGTRIRHVHLKEARLPGIAERLLGTRLRRRLGLQPEPVFPGKGSLDVGQLKRTLAEAGYRGAVSIEYEGAESTAALAELLAAWQM